MRLVRLEPGQLWLMTWHDRDVGDDRLYLILLLRWDPFEKQWWILKTKMNGRMRYHPSASLWNEEIIDLDKVNRDSYTIERVA